MRHCRLLLLFYMRWCPFPQHLFWVFFRYLPHFRYFTFKNSCNCTFARHEYIYSFFLSGRGISRQFFRVCCGFDDENNWRPISYSCFILLWYFDIWRFIFFSKINFKMRAPHWKLFSELVQRHIGNYLPLGVKNILKAAKGKQNRLSARTAGFFAFFFGRETIRPIFWKLTEVYKLIFDIIYKTFHPAFGYAAIEKNIRKGHKRTQ